MPTFEISEPITVRIEADGGLIRLVAIERADTIIEVRPHDQSHEVSMYRRQRLPPGWMYATASCLFLATERQNVACHSFEAGSSTSKLCCRHGRGCMRRWHLPICVLKVNSPTLDSWQPVATSKSRWSQEKTKAVNASGSLTVRTVQGNAVVATMSGKVTIRDLGGELKSTVASG